MHNILFFISPEINLQNFLQQNSRGKETTGEVVCHRYGEKYLLTPIVIESRDANENQDVMVKILDKIHDILKGGKANTVAMQIFERDQLTSQVVVEKLVLLALKVPGNKLILCCNDGDSPDKILQHVENSFRMAKERKGKERKATFYRQLHTCNYDLLNCK